MELCRVRPLNIEQSEHIWGFEKWELRIREVEQFLGKSI
jgi:hypothetical protein